MKFDTNLSPTVREIMRITGVSERTARRWQREGGPAYAVRLIHLTLRGRIMPESWPQHWRFSETDHIETDSCHPALKWQHLTWYQYIVSGWHEALATIPRIEDAIRYLTDKLPKAEVIELEAYRAQMEALRNSRPTDPLTIGLEPAPAKETSRKHGC